MEGGDRGGSFYDDPAVFGRYRAHRQGGARSPNHVMEEPAVQRALGPMIGQRVLDLGCGDAAFGRTLLTAGARSYLGVDGSAEMVAAARSTLTGTTGRVVHADLEDLDLAADSADVVVSRLALHYVDDLHAVLASCHRALTDGGRLVMTVVHPVITSHHTPSTSPSRTSWVVDDYFTSGPRQKPWMGSTVTWYHRSIEQYLHALEGAGFRLTKLSECEPVASFFDEDIDELERRRRVPLFLLLAATRD